MKGSAEPRLSWMGDEVVTADAVPRSDGIGAPNLSTFFLETAGALYTITYGASDNKCGCPTIQQWSSGYWIRWSMFSSRLTAYRGGKWLKVCGSRLPTPFYALSSDAMRHQKVKSFGITLCAAGHLLFRQGVSTNTGVTDTGVSMVDRPSVNNDSK
jgi:hypothetical protein